MFHALRYGRYFTAYSIKIVSLFTKVLFFRSLRLKIDRLDWVTTQRSVACNKIDKSFSYGDDNGFNLELVICCHFDPLYETWILRISKKIERSSSLFDFPQRINWPESTSSLLCFPLLNYIWCVWEFFSLQSQLCLKEKIHRCLNGWKSEILDLHEGLR